MDAVQHHMGNTKTLPEHDNGYEGIHIGMNNISEVYKTKYVEALQRY